MKQPKILNMFEIASILCRQYSVETQRDSGDPCVLRAQGLALHPGSRAQGCPCSPKRVIRRYDAESADELFEEITPPSTPNGLYCTHAKFSDRHERQQKFRAPRCVHVSLCR